MKIETFPMGVFQVNSFLLFCEETGESVVVDPGDHPEILIARYEALGRSPVAILNTHGHIDHVAGNRAIKDRWDVPILMHPGDGFLIETFDQQAALFGLDMSSPPAPDGELSDGVPFRFGACRLEIIHTPGHSPGHVVLASGSAAISGDLIFAGSIGRTDLPGGDLGTLLRSVDRLGDFLPDETVLHPGHGPATTLGEERRTNPFLQPGFRSQMLGGS